MTRIALASLFAVGLAVGGAQAQAPSTLDITGYVSGGRVGNVVGGGSATMSGGSDDRVIAYGLGGAGGGAPAIQSGRSARLLGGDGDGPQLEYLTLAPAGAGREAWLNGGGDDAQVVYTSPSQRR
jgi:hypothetical protein